MTLDEYITTEVGGLTTISGWDTDTDNDFVASMTYMQLGISDESEESNKIKLFAVAKVNIYARLINLLTSTSFNVSVDGGSFSKSQILDNVRQVYKDSISESMPYLPTLAIKRSQLKFVQDHYEPDIFC